MTTPTPAIPTFSDGVPAHANALNALGSNITNLYNYALGSFVTAPPFCIANQTSTQSIPNNAYTSVTYNTTIVNVSNMWVASVPGTLTVGVAGTYIVWGQVIFAGNTTGYRGSQITVNGGVLTGQNMPNNPGGFVTCQALGVYKMSAGASIVQLAWQNTGGPLSTSTGGLLNCSLAALWLSS
jgi:hypothetical protein